MYNKCILCPFFARLSFKDPKDAQLLEDCSEKNIPDMHDIYKIFMQ